MKVLYIIDQKPDGYPGGIEHHLLDLVSFMTKNKEPVYVLFPEKDSLRLRLYRDYDIEEHEYKGGRIDDHRLNDVYIENTVSAILDEIDVDILHFHSIRTLPLSLVELAKNRGKQVVLTLHEYYFWCINCIMLSPDFCWFERDSDKCFRCLVQNGYMVDQDYVGQRRKYIDYLFSIVDRVIVPSNYVKNVFLSLYSGLSYDKCIVVELGVDKQLLRKGRNNGRASGKDRLHLAFLGNFLHYKGNKAFLELIKKYRDSKSVKFSIIGNIFDPLLIPSYKNLDVLGGYSRLDVVDIIRSAGVDLTLLLSNWPETFSYTLSESIAAGVPVIATDAGALRERVSKNNVGFLVPVESPVKRITEIIEDIKTKPEVVAFFGERTEDARRRLRTVDEMAEENFRIYSSLK
jgi:glycosyltransferase involved in cell wall biosynthesis